MSFLSAVPATIVVFGITAFMMWKYIQKQQARTRRFKRAVYIGVSGVLNDLEGAFDAFRLFRKVGSFIKVMDSLIMPAHLQSITEETERFNRILYHEKMTAEDILKKINIPAPVSTIELEEYKVAARKQFKFIDDLFARRRTESWKVENENKSSEVEIKLQGNITIAYDPFLILSARVSTALISLKRFELMMIGFDKIATQVSVVISVLIFVEMRLDHILRKADSVNYIEDFIYSPELLSYYREASKLSLLVSEKMN